MPLPTRLLTLLQTLDAMRAHPSDGEPAHVRRSPSGAVNAATVDGWSNALARVTATTHRR